MAEGPFAYLARDLRQALAAGAGRTPAVTDGGRWLALWALACALAGAALFLWGGYRTGFLPVNALAAHLPGWVWEWLTVLGDERVAFALTLFFSRRYPRVFWTLALAALAGIAYGRSLKPLFDAVRPPGVLDPNTFNLIGPALRKVSFPSGHSITVGVFCGVWVYYLRSNAVRAALIAIAVMAGISRVAVGVHWPVDVAAGLLGGVAATWLGVALARKAQWGIAYLPVHLTCVALAALSAASLFYSDGGYAAAAGLQRAIGAAALGYAAFVYLIAPLARRGCG